MPVLDRAMVPWTRCSSAIRLGARRTLLIVSILIVRAGADQAGSTERIELYDALERALSTGGLADLRRRPRRDHFEIVRIRQIRSDPFGNEFTVYLVLGVAKVFGLRIEGLSRAGPESGVNLAKLRDLLVRE